jgi:hypothetical protein
LILIVLLTSLLISSVAIAINGYTISWWTIDGGGSRMGSLDGQYSIVGTIGQPDASDQMVGGSFSLVGGFHGGSPSTPVDIWQYYYLPFVLR